VKRLGTHLKERRESGTLARAGKILDKRRGIGMRANESTSEVESSATDD
jgi:hypothetical protein